MHMPRRPKAAGGPAWDCRFIRVRCVQQKGAGSSVRHPGPKSAPPSLFRRGSGCFCGSGEGRWHNRRLCLSPVRRDGKPFPTLRTLPPQPPPRRRVLPAPGCGSCPSPAISTGFRPPTGFMKQHISPPLTNRTNRRMGHWYPQAHAYIRRVGRRLRLAFRQQWHRHTGSRPRLSILCGSGSPFRPPQGRRKRQQCGPSDNHSAIILACLLLPEYRRHRRLAPRR